MYFQHLGFYGDVVTASRGSRFELRIYTPNRHLDFLGLSYQCLYIYSTKFFLHSVHPIARHKVEENNLKLS